jgi:hypothetical protein
MEVSDQLHTPLPLYYPGYSLRYALYRRFGRPQSQSGRYEGEKNLSPPLGIEP